MQKTEQLITPLQLLSINKYKKLPVCLIQLFFFFFFLVGLKKLFELWETNIILSGNKYMKKYLRLRSLNKTSNVELLSAGLWGTGSGIFFNCSSGLYQQRAGKLQLKPQQQRLLRRNCCFPPIGWKVESQNFFTGVNWR